MNRREAQQLSEHVEEMLAEVEQSAIPAVTERVEELVRALVSLYGAGLERVLELIAPEEVRVLAEDELVGALLVLHDLHPDDVTTRVQQALDGVRPYLGSHAGGVELVGVDEGVVHLRLEGSCDGCPSSALTVKSAIEDAVLGTAPDVLAVEVEGMVPAGPPLLQIQPYDGPREGGDRDWVHIDVDVPPGSCSSVATAGGPVLVANVDGSLLAYQERCPDCERELASGHLDGAELTCAGCGHRFDVRAAGRGLDADAHLEPIPMLPEGTGWKVSLPARVGA